MYEFKCNYFFPADSDILRFPINEFIILINERDLISHDMVSSVKIFFHFLIYTSFTCISATMR